MTMFPKGFGIYFVAAGDHVKIGCSTRIHVRLSVLQSSHVESLEYLGHIELGKYELTLDELKQCEAAIHRVFASKRVVGEWFRLDDDAAKMIETLVSTPAYVCGGCVLGTPDGEAGYTLI